VTFSALDHLECPRCGTTYDATVQQGLCPGDGSPLLARYDLARHGNATTAEFVALAEQVSGQDLGGFLEVWLEKPERPARTAANGL
jgi:hypothetical protein